MEPKEYQEAEYPDSYRLSYHNPLTNTFGVAHSRIPSQIFASMEKIGGTYSWKLEKGRDGFWNLLEVFEHPEHQGIIPQIN